MKSYRTPYATWLGSPNFTPDRSGHDMAVQPAWVVLHTMVGTEAAANTRFQQPAEQASAHYGVKLDGSVVQWVDEKDAAWTNGNSGVEGAIGRNEDSVTIEHEDDGDYNGPRTPELYAASARLVRDICLRYGVPIDRQHVIGHRECTGNAPTACPDALDMDRIVAAAANPTPSDSFALIYLGGSDTMIRLNFANKLHRLWIAQDGTVRWGAYPGGSGGIEGYSGPVSALGSPTGAQSAIAIGGLAVTPEVFQGVNRLSIECRWSDGAVRQKIMNADDFSLVEDWKMIDTTPPELAGATTGPVAPHSHSLTLSGRTDTGG